MTYIFEICISYRIFCIKAFFDSIIIFHVMGLFVCWTYALKVHRRLPLIISLTNSNQMITIFHLPFYRDSETFLTRFSQPTCFTSWLHLGSKFSVSTACLWYNSDIFNIFYFFHFPNDL